MTKLYRLNDVTALTGLGRSTIYRMMEDGSFPKPLKLGKRAVAWTEEMIEEWVSSRPTA